ncbi:hypothetical protein PM082_009386 [Marasmius tenuissimus]|nr:hypothetical protein PM082_009386 [Marasmius tenuissimus]
MHHNKPTRTPRLSTSMKVLGRYTYLHNSRATIRLFRLRTASTVGCGVVLNFPEYRFCFSIPSSYLPLYSPSPCCYPFASCSGLCSFSFVVSRPRLDGSFTFGALGSTPSIILSSLGGHPNEC